MKITAQGSLEQVNEFARFVEDHLGLEGVSILTRITRRTLLGDYSVQLVIEDYDGISPWTGLEQPQTTSKTPRSRGLDGLIDPGFDS